MSTRGKNRQGSIRQWQNPRPSMSSVENNQRPLLKFSLKLSKHIHQQFHDNKLKDKCGNTTYPLFNNRTSVCGNGISIFRSRNAPTIA
jgi:hypothetical protein